MPRKKQSSSEDRQTVQRPRTTSASRVSRPARAAGAPAAAVACVLGLALALWAAPAAAQSRAELEKVLRRHVLANGMEIIVVESHGVPLATLEIDVRNGAYTQSPAYEGLAHMYEHMFFQANAALPDYDRFSARTSELGAVYNGSTQEERVNYYLTVPADSAQGAMTLLAAALRTPLFREDELAREKYVVLGEYDRAESNPFFAFNNEMTRRLYPGSFSRKNVIGSRDIIRSVTPEKMREIQRRYYVPNNAVLIVTGDVNPARVFAMAERAFGDWPRGANPFEDAPVPAIPPLAHNEGVVAEAPTSAVTVLVQWQGPSVQKDPGATYAADVFSDVMNTAGSTFQRRLVDSGLWQGVLVNYYTLNQVGPITISGQTTAGKLRQALAALDAEIAHVADSGYFSADELESVKAQRAVSSAFGLERASSLAHTIGFWWSVADLDYFMGYVDNMARQRPADLRAYARAYIIGRPRVVGVMLSPEDRRALGLTEAQLAQSAVAP